MSLSHTRSKKVLTSDHGCEISIIIPVYNEANILRKNVSAVEEVLKKVTYSYEIIVAEDGSTDGTDKIAADLAIKNSKIRHLHADERLGRGLSIKKAMKVSKGHIVAFMDADLAASLEHLSALIAAIRYGYHIAVGSKYIGGSVVKRPFLRVLASRTYNSLVRLLFRDGIRDHECGFKAFSRKALEYIVQNVESSDWLVETELIVKAKRSGYSIVEIPVKWVEPKGRIPRFKLIKDGLQMGIKLLHMRIKLWINS